MESIDNLRGFLERVDAKMSDKRAWLTPEASRRLVEIVNGHLDVIEKEVDNALCRN